MNGVCVLDDYGARRLSGGAFNAVLLCLKNMEQTPSKQVSIGEEGSGGCILNGVCVLDD